MQRPLDDLVRGVYHRDKADPATFVLIPIGSNARPFGCRYALPPRLHIDGERVTPQLADGSPDNRYPTPFNVALVAATDPPVLRAHITHTLRGAMSIGSVYMFFPTPTELWVDVVTKGTDVNEPAATYRRVCSLAGFDEPDQVAMWRQRVSVALFAHTPMTIHRTSQLIAEK
jgi:hypothetical protein